MKKAIEYLETALEKLGYVTPGIVYTVCEKPYFDALEFLRAAIAELKNKPRWETPEQWEKRTGKVLPDGWAVYVLYEDNTNGNRWVFCESYYYAVSETCEGNRLVAIVCATEAGPPPDTWVPEAKQ